MPFSLQRSTISCWGRAGWFSIWFTAGSTLATGMSCSRYLLLYCRWVSMMLLEKRDSIVDLTLETPIAFVLPVSKTASICFQVSRWLWLRIMSREPSGFLGNLSSLPIVIVNFKPLATMMRKDHLNTLRVHQNWPVLESISSYQIFPKKFPHTTRRRST